MANSDLRESLVDRAPSNPDLSSQPPPQAWCVTAAVAASLLAFAWMQSPVPGVNEAHYLCKARHYWDPSWCAGDLFLESTPAHCVFYQLAGWITQYWTLTQTAWILRVAGTLLLSHGWVQMARQFAGPGWAALWSAWLFVAQSVVVSFSGEWIVGGAESKVFAYGCVLWALASVGRRLWWRGAALTGLSISLHPVVGVWCLVCGGSALLLMGAERPRVPLPWLRLGGCLALLITCALPGLWPAMELAVGGGSPPGVQTDADYIQVFYRLAHHLDPHRFPPRVYLLYGGMLLAWVGWQRRNCFQAAGDPRAPSADSSADQHGWNRRFLYRFVMATAAVALCGVLLGWGPRPALEMPAFALRAKLLRFYPFRIFDVMLPLAWCLVLSEKMSSAAWGAAGSRLRRCGPWAVATACFAFSLMFPAASRDPDRMHDQRRRDWEQVCRWVRTQTPKQALVFTPRDSYAFKWYAERPEYVSAKDCPQDAAGIVEWFRRSRLATRWAAESVEKGRFDLTSFRDPGTGAEIQYAVLDAPGDPGTRPVYANRWFRVYKLSGTR